MRIEDHPILSFPEEEEVTFTYEGQEVTGKKGETIAAALHNQGVIELRKSGEENRSRGLFCAIGKCSSCLMKVDGVPNVRTCITEVREGMEVEKQSGFPELPSSKGKLNPGLIDSEKTEVLVIGSGPAGLRAALTAARAGARVTIVDENPFLGGQLVKQTHKFFGSSEEEAGQRGIDIGEELTEKVKQEKRIEVMTSASAVGIYDGSAGVYVNRKKFVRIEAEKIIVATGAIEDTVRFPNNDLAGVYGAGGVQTLMNVYGVKPGSSALMVGAGNVGLIVAYQLLQAGVDLKGIVEIAPEIGGYFVHAAKVRRAGVPILTNHEVIRVTGEEKVEKATIAEVDKDGNRLGGSEKNYEIEFLALGVGLSPSYRLLHHAGCELTLDRRLGGYVPRKGPRMKTSREDVYAAGDVTGVEEATSASLEGAIAGADAAIALGKGGRREEETVEKAREELAGLRSGPYYEGIRKGVKEVRLERD